MHCIDHDLAFLPISQQWDLFYNDLSRVSITTTWIQGQLA